MTGSMLDFICVLLLALAIDLIAGDPVWMPHPVRWIGRAAVLFERVLRPVACSPFMERFCGAVFALAVVGLAYAVTAALLYLAYSRSFLVFSALCVYIIWTCLAIRSLGDEALSVLSALNADGTGGDGPGGIEAARKRLARIVGRDTENLSKEAVLKASAETVAENTSDAVVAPLFYLALGGPALMMAYKAVNTLDSMAGYKNAKYIRFGWASARLDDAANFVPARLTALLMVMASFILSYNWRGALRTVIRDAGKHPSPNSGWPEAAVAGALGIRLGGASTYNGIPFEKPFIGDGTARIMSGTALSAIKMMYSSAFIMVIATVIIRKAVLLLL
ncbi:MAG: cobalamin biosynthesis protein CobD [Deltaproteobacteria bacterium]|nr:cobalamin biosynthesis protein CobD [Deltaproteobacteria bacterium]